MEELGIGKVSVIVPMYNNEKTIINALESIRNQTSIHLISEIIVVNDGSTDNSFRITREYANSHEDMRIKLIDKVNGGVSSARNMGMKKAKSEFIALLDSDDEWLPNKIEVQMKTFSQHPEIDFLGGDANGKKIRILYRKINKLYKANVKDLCLKAFPVTPSAVFRRKIIQEVGYFDENQKFGEDINYFTKICSKYNYYHLPVQMVICGSGKHAFGHSGLSENLKEMYEGTIKNIKEFKMNSMIGQNFYAFLRLFYLAKYIRRIIITKFRKISRI